MVLAVLFSLYAILKLSETHRNKAKVELYTEKPHCKLSLQRRDFVLLGNKQTIESSIFMFYSLPVIANLLVHLLNLVTLVRRSYCNISVLYPFVLMTALGISTYLT